jgi:hypothetical protein
MLQAERQRQREELKAKLVAALQGVDRGLGKKLKIIIIVYTIAV